MSFGSSIKGTKAFAIVGTVFLLSAVVILYVVPPARGYEASVYRAYPWYFWASIVGAMFFGQLVLIRSIGSPTRDGHDQDRVFGASLIVIPGLLLTFLPYIRGYPMYGRADAMTHIGLVRDLAEAGIAENIYAPTHLLLHSLASATGLEPMALINLLPVVFTLLFFGSMYFLVVTLFERRARILLVLPFVLLPIASSSHVNAIPYVFSVLLVPLALFLFVKERQTFAIPVRVMLLFAVVGIVLYHPLTAVFIGIVFFLYVALEWVPPIESWGRAPTYVGSLTLVVFGAWYTNYAGIIVRFRNIVTDFLGPDAGESELEATTATIEQTSPDPFDIVRIAILQYGIDVVLFGLASTFLALVAYRWLRHRIAPSLFVMLFGGTTLLFAGAGVVFLTNDLIVGFGRPLMFGKVFAVILAGALWYTLWSGTENSTRSTRSTAFTVGLALVLFTLVLLSVFSMFHSPVANQTNHQVTEMELQGMEWTFENRNEAYLIDEFGIRQYRFDHARHGTIDYTPAMRSEETLPPPHFNYTEHETLGASYDFDRYMIITEQGRIAYPTRFPGYEDQWRYTAADFERLEYDSSVTRVYDNGEFDLYRIEGGS